jgi:hypothetical protein
MGIESSQIVHVLVIVVDRFWSVARVGINDRVAPDSHSINGVSGNAARRRRQIEVQRHALNVAVQSTDRREVEFIAARVEVCNGIVRIRRTVPYKRRYHVHRPSMCRRYHHQ